MNDTNNMTWLTKTPYSDKNIKSFNKSNSQPAGVFAGGQGNLEKTRPKPQGNYNMMKLFELTGNRNNRTSQSGRLFTNEKSDSIPSDSDGNNHISQESGIATIDPKQKLTSVKRFYSK
jgi:hypothetical protein